MPTSFYRGAGGSILELPVPLSENMANQLARGELVAVNPDGTPLDAAPSVELPAANAPKNEWVGYAVSQGMKTDDADAMTKADLVAKFGKK